MPRLNLRELCVLLHHAGDFAAVCINFGVLRVHRGFSELAEIDVALIEVVVLHAILFCYNTETDIKCIIYESN